MIINIISKVLVLDFYVLANSGKKLLNSCSVRIYKALQTLKIDNIFRRVFRSSLDGNAILHQWVVNLWYVYCETNVGGALGAALRLNCHKNRTALVKICCDF